MTNTSTTIASPTKLRSGAWGAKVQGQVDLGETITIRTRAGKTWQARVTRIVWSGNGVTLCETTSTQRRRPARRRGTWTGCSCGSVEEYARPGDCFTCRHDRY